MKNELITDIFYNVVKEIEPDEKCKNAYDSCMAIIENIAIDRATFLDLESDIIQIAAEHERNAFIIGFKTAMELIGECFSANKMQPDTNQSNQGCTAKSVM